MLINNTYFNNKTELINTRKIFYLTDNCNVMDIKCFCNVSSTLDLHFAMLLECSQCLQFNVSEILIQR